MKKFCSILLALLIVGCSASSPSRLPSGKEARPPIGAVDFCKRNPGDEKCQS